MVRTFSRIIVLIINLLFVAGSIIIIISVNVSPAHCWYFALGGYANPIVLAGHLFFGIFWLFRQHKLYSLISISCLCVGIYLGGLPFQYHKRKKEKGIKLVSYNVQEFDLYNWHGNGTRRDSLIAYIKEMQPDIICIQECSVDKNTHFYTNDSVKKATQLKYMCFEPLVSVDNLYDFGLTIYSKYPIVRHRKLFDVERSTNNIIITDVKIGDDTVRFFNCHLESLHFEIKEYATIEKISDRNFTEQDTTGIRFILQKLKKALIKRANQADSISIAIKKSPYPVIVCGDFNDIPLSYTYHTIKTHNDLVDAFRNAGNGLGGTYIGKLPSFRIDYILHSKRIETWDFRVGKRILSDHYPIYCQFIVGSK